MALLAKPVQQDFEDLKEGIILLGMGVAFNAHWYTSSGSIGMLLMFLFASIPMKEKQMIKKRPEAFKKYKSEVSLLIPWPYKKGS